MTVTQSERRTLAENLHDGALQYILARTRFGSRLRAAVDDQRVAAGLGINVNLVFLATFAVFLQRRLQESEAGLAHAQEVAERERRATEKEKALSEE